MSLALWLRTGRTERGLSLDDVARTTKIQARILERLEGGSIHSGDGLPAEVFVRGFIRSIAKCCGLDEAEALTRYSAAAQARLTATAPAMPSTLAHAPGPAARAVVEAMADLAPQVARTTQPKLAAALPIDIPELALAAGSLAIPVVVEAEVAEEAKPTSNRQKKKQRNKKRAKRGTHDRADMATGTPSAPMAVVTAVEAVEAAPVEAASGEAAPGEAAPVEAAPASVDAAPVVDHLDPLVVPADANEDIVATEIWQPKMPAAPVPSVPWRRPAYAASAKALAVPTLVIDDADPDSAEQVVEDRAAARSVLTNAQRRSFLPPILLDREDRSARQGGLTLAVIILLIAATLTLSYLMRRPSSSGDGVTSTDVETLLVG